MQKNVASIHEALDEARQFKASLGFVLFLLVLLLYFMLNSSRDEHNQSVKRRITEEIRLKQGNLYSQAEIQSTVFKLGNCWLFEIFFMIRGYPKVF